MKEHPMQDEPTGGRNGGDQHGAQARQQNAEVKEHLRAARDAAGTMARERAHQAQGWAQSQWNTLQDRVEAEPYRATAWALGIGFVAGIILTALASGSRR
jgi:ElaB/YqjD/DUF883 family membrane-anchored ribosome-binding protein